MVVHSLSMLKETSLLTVWEHSVSSKVATLIAQTFSIMCLKKYHVSMHGYLIIPPECVLWDTIHLSTIVTNFLECWDHLPHCPSPPLPICMHVLSTPHTLLHYEVGHFVLYNYYIDSGPPAYTTALLVVALIIIIALVVVVVLLACWIIAARRRSSSVKAPLVRNNCMSDDVEVSISKEKKMATAQPNYNASDVTTS